MTHAISIRNAGPDDAESIAAIHIASWRATYRGSIPDSYLDSLTIEQRLPMWKQVLVSASPLVRVWVAERDDEIVGFCSVGPPLSQADEPDDSLVLHTIYLDPNSIRRGIGRQLLDHAEHQMSRMDATTATLWVLESNEPAKRFYEAAGWTTDGTEQLDEIFGQTVREVRYRKRLAGDRSP